MEENQRSNKRRKLEDEQRAPRCVTDLPDDLLRHCISFVGPGNYRFVAGTCHRFQDLYSFSRETVLKNAVATIPCAALCRKDGHEVPESFPQVSFPHGRLSPMQVIVRHAIRVGNLNVVQWAVDEEKARANGFDVVGFIISKAGIAVEAFEESAMNGHIHVLEWILQHMEFTFEWQVEVASAAARSGQVSVFGWMNGKGLLDTDDWNEWSGSIWSEAAVEGYTNVFQWLFDFGFTIPEPTRCILRAAIRKGHVHVLRWARDRQVGEWVASNCAYAAAYGRLDSLSWLRENDCPWDSNTIACAVANSHPSIAERARDNGCPEPNGLEEPILVPYRDRETS